MISITFGDKERRIEYNTHAGCLMEDKAGRSLMQIVNAAIVQQDMRSARLMLWGGLLKHYPDTTLEDAEDLTDLHEDRIALTSELYEEMKSAGFFGKAAKEPPKKKERSAKSTGG